jgi:hypothetical protein
MYSDPMGPSFAVHRLSDIVEGDTKEFLLKIFIFSTFLNLVEYLSSRDHSD